MTNDRRRSAARALDTNDERPSTTGDERDEERGSNVIPLTATACAQAARAKDALAREEAAKPAEPAGPGELDLLVDGRRVTVEANRELVLKCGKASITLTRAGKIILRGTH